MWASARYGAPRAWSLRAGAGARLRVSQGQCAGGLYGQRRLSGQRRPWPGQRGAQSVLAAASPLGKVCEISKFRAMTQDHGRLRALLIGQTNPHVLQEPAARVGSGSEGSLRFGSDGRKIASASFLSAESMLLDRVGILVTGSLIRKPDHREAHGRIPGNRPLLCLNQTLIELYRC